MKPRSALWATLLFVLGSFFLTSNTALADGGSSWRFLSLGSKSVVVGVHSHPDMDWTKTQHIITLSNGKTKKTKWYNKKVGKRIFETFKPNGSVKVRYNVDNGNSSPDMTSITVRLRDSSGNVLCEETYNVP